MDKNSHKTASQMLHPELTANGDTSVEIATLRVQMNHLESRNTLLYEEVLRLRAERDEVQNELNAMTKRIGDASFLLCDWDGYYNPETRNGNAEELAKLIEEGFIMLQGRSWRDPHPEEGQ
jgi:uncharacterized protein YPO0396